MRWDLSWGVFLLAEPPPEPGDSAGMGTNAGDTKVPDGHVSSSKLLDGFHPKSWVFHLSKAGTGAMSLPTLAVWKWGERKRAVKQTKALMHVASFPLRLQSLLKMLILAGSKRRLALIWTTLRDLGGGHRAWDGLCLGMGHPGVSHSSTFALSPPFPSFSQKVEEHQKPSPSRAQGDSSHLGTLSANNFKGLSEH